MEEEMKLQGKIIGVTFGQRVDILGTNYVNVTVQVLSQRVGEGSINASGIARRLQVTGHVDIETRE